MEVGLGALDVVVEVVSECVDEVNCLVPGGLILEVSGEEHWKRREGGREGGRERGRERDWDSKGGGSVRKMEGREGKKEKK